MQNEKKLFPRELMTTIELMESLKVSRQTLHNWREQGLPFIRVGRGIRYNFQEVGEWLERQNK